MRLELASGASSTAVTSSLSARPRVLAISCGLILGCLMLGCSTEESVAASTNGNIGAETDADGAPRDNDAQADDPTETGVSPEPSASEVDDSPGTVTPYDYATWAERNGHSPLAALADYDAGELERWQDAQRTAFKERLYFPYEGEPTFQRAAVSSQADIAIETWHVRLDKQLLFRYFELTPTASSRGKLLVFMGHGHVEQLLSDRNSYQRAAGLALAEAGYHVYVMENVAMGPDDPNDAHLQLDSVLTLNGYSWYSLLFAHQAMLIEHVLADRTPGEHLGAAGVSTGGLLALTAAALHPEVDAASVHGIFASALDSFGRDFAEHCECGSISGLLPQFDLPSLALMVAPQPLHINNNLDDTFPAEDANDALTLIEPLASRLGGPSPTFTSPPGKHSFALAETLEFFASVWADTN